MIIPAILMKKEIEEAFDRLQYSEKLMFYDGSIENYRHEVKEENDHYQYAVVDPNREELNRYQLIGLISFRIDWYSKQAYNFGLIRFADSYYSISQNRRIKTQMVMASAILEVVKMLTSFNLHRIEFRCVEGNPAIYGYKKICEKYAERVNHPIIVHFLRMDDVYRDRQGHYRDMHIFEIMDYFTEEKKTAKGQWVVDGKNDATCSRCGQPAKLPRYFCGWCGCDMRAF